METRELFGSIPQAGRSSLVSNFLPLLRIGALQLPSLASKGRTAQES